MSPFFMGGMDGGGHRYRRFLLTRAAARCFFATLLLFGNIEYNSLLTKDLPGYPPPTASEMMQKNNIAAA